MRITGMRKKLLAALWEGIHANAENITAVHDVLSSDLRSIHALQRRVHVLEAHLKDLEDPGITSMQAARNEAYRQRQAMLRIERVPVTVNTAATRDLFKVAGAAYEANRAMGMRISSRVDHPSVKRPPKHRKLGEVDVPYVIEDLKRLTAFMKEPDFFVNAEGDLSRSPDPYEGRTDGFVRSPDAS